MAQGGIQRQAGHRGQEHQKILAGERNSEWRAYYKLLWHIGGSQTEVANLRAEDIDWEMKVIGFNRMKTGSIVRFSFGEELAGILSDLPGESFLLPRIAKMKESDRAKAFIRRCGLAGVSGVSLHSYRYSWAERAKEAGYPERFAQENLGHGSKAVTRACKESQSQIAHSGRLRKASNQQTHASVMYTTRLKSKYRQAFVSSLFDFCPASVC